MYTQSWTSLYLHNGKEYTQHALWCVVNTSYTYNTLRPVYNHYCAVITQLGILPTNNIAGSAIVSIEMTLIITLVRLKGNISMQARITLLTHTHTHTHTHTAFFIFFYNIQNNFLCIIQNFNRHKKKIDFSNMFTQHGMSIK